MNSKISKMFLSLFSLGYGECLNNEPPASEYEMIKEPPGEIYPVDQQCELVFGEGSRICPYMVRTKIEKNIQLRHEDMS